LDQRRNNEGHWAKYIQQKISGFMSPMLSKSKFIAGWQCEKQAYLNANFLKLATPQTLYESSVR